MGTEVIDKASPRRTAKNRPLLLKDVLTEADDLSGQGATRLFLGRQPDFSAPFNLETDRLSG